MGTVHVINYEVTYMFTYFVPQYALFKYSEMNRFTINMVFVTTHVIFATYCTLFYYIELFTYFYQMQKRFAKQCLIVNAAIHHKEKNIVQDIGRL